MSLAITDLKWLGCYLGSMFVLLFGCICNLLLTVAKKKKQLLLCGSGLPSEKAMIYSEHSDWSLTLVTVKIDKNGDNLYLKSQFFFFPFCHHFLKCASVIYKTSSKEI